MPFAEDFDALTLGDLNGQNGWVADGVDVQSNVTYGASAKAASITSTDGSMTHTFGGAETDVWTDMMVQAVPGNDADVTMAADATFGVYAASNGHWVVFDGTNTVELTDTVSTGVWTRVTINSDYVAKTWDLYLDGALATNGLGFYNTSATALTELGVIGAGDSQAYVDDISLGLSNPLPAAPEEPGGFIGTLVIGR